MQDKVMSLSILAALAALPLAAVAAPVEAPTAASASGRDLPALEHRWAVPLMFNSFDTNKDGYISRLEAGASSLLATEFNQLDRDGDGRLSVDELGAASPGPD
jgi:EF hand domain-containing protein